MATVSQKHLKETKDTLDEAKRLEEALQAKSLSNKEAQKQLTTKYAAVVELNKKLDRALSEAQPGQSASSTTELTEETALSLVKPRTKFHAAWLAARDKRAGLEDSVMQLNRAYGDNLIDLPQYLTTMRKLSDKIFRCIYKQQTFDQQHHTA